MRKIILISISAIALFLLGIYVLFSIYSKKLESNLRQIESQISPIYNKVMLLSNNRIIAIKNAAVNSDCIKDGGTILDSILLKRNKESVKFISKDYNYDEAKTNKILNELYKCKKINRKLLESSIEPLNNSLNISSLEYNNKAREFNSIFAFPNSLFVDFHKFQSKIVIRINYLGPLEDEIKKQEDIEEWIKTGRLPNEQKDTK